MRRPPPNRETPTVTTYTYCQICEQACGLVVTTVDGRIAAIEPDRDNRHSWRDFCVKAANAPAVVEHPRRLLQPMRRVGDRYLPATYEEAIDDIARRLARIRADHGAEAIASYAGNPSGMHFASGVMLSLFMNGLGSHNHFWVGSVDQNALHYVAEQMYGSPWVMLHPDVDNCECFLLIGSNPAVSTMCWIGRVPNGWKRILERQRQGATLVVVDPRRTESARKADVHLAPRPDQDWALLLAVIRVIFDHDWLDAGDCAQARGIGELRDIAGSVSLEALAARCDLPLDAIRDVAERFATARTAVCLARTGPAQGINGTLTEWLSHVLNLITGRTDRAGGRVYNPGIVDPLRAGDAVFRPNRTPSRVRGLPTVAGAHALAELADEIRTPGVGQVRALFVLAGNPVVSGPDGHTLDAALGELDLLVAIDLVQRESHRHAHWLIPATHWLERSEFHPLLSGMTAERFAQFARAAVDPPTGVRHEWEFLRDLAFAMKLPLVGGTAGTAALRACTRLSRWLAKPGLAFDPAWLARLMVRQSGVVGWQTLREAPHGVVYGEPPVDELRSRLTTVDGRIDAAPRALLGYLRERLASSCVADPEFPLQLLSRRRKQTMNSWLADLAPPAVVGQDAATVGMCAADAAAFGVRAGQRVQVASRANAVEAVVEIDDDLRPGTVLMAQGWGSRVFDPFTGEAQAIGINRNLLVSNDDLDPLSAVPRLNGTPVTVKPLVS
ncbi:MAG: molybdopterin-dependent oxidoreductase [Gammaproteobacteria bacterium]|nr:molybdopterin-dependent oxidoreductase [Gammaproteobacteria bacterium]